MKIMIVDDSSFIVLICRQTLLAAGYDVVGEAFDGVTAIQKAEKLKPDLVILDLALPKKNGFEVAEALKESLPNTKILFISAVDEEWAKEKVVAVGGYGFLAKPFENSQLLDYVRLADEKRGALKYG